MSAYLSLCAIYRNEAPYLREWIEFHRLVGVERFFLYDNMSTDEHRDVVDDYAADGTAVLHEWPHHPGQGGAYDHCLAEHGHESRWIAFLDLDEFLFSPSAEPVSELLHDYEQWAGVGVNRAVYGSSGHRNRPEGLVIESYLTWWPKMVTAIKSIIDPRRVIRHQNPHAFVYREGEFAVDEHKRPIERWRTDEYTMETLRINHYYTKSETEFRGKLAHERADNAAMREEPRNWERLSGTDRDESILAYADALREAVARSSARA
jgi:hypothetical protein